jgi:hypothetical protein
MIMADLDIIIVNWNAGNQLFECLKSIQHSNTGIWFRLAKCIVVDNASTDGSADFIESRVKTLPLELVRNTVNGGFGFACNQGAERGNSEYILFLNPDVRLFPDSLSKAVSFMELPENRQIGVLGIQMIDQNGLIHRNIAHFPSPGSFFYQMLGLDRFWPSRFPPHFVTDSTYLENRVVDQVPGAFFLVRRTLFKNLNGFDERFFMYFEDLDFAYRARLAGRANYYLSTAKAFHQGGGTTEQVKALRLFYILRSRTYYIAKHFGYHQALWSAVLALTIEVWIRLGWHLVNLSGRSFLETLQAYILYVKELPILMGNMKR